MKKLFLFMMVSLDGFMEGPNHDLSWHNVDDEFNTFAAEQMNEMGTILFGRRTYQLMEDYWPTAKPSDPNDAIVAERMNNLPKIVFSKKLTEIQEKNNWKHVRLVRNNIAEEVKKLKQQAKKDIAVIGSNHLCVSLLEMELFDELRIMINPVVIGKGTVLFAVLKNKLNLELVKTKRFQNGNVLLYYKVLK